MILDTESYNINYIYIDFMGCRIKISRVKYDGSLANWSAYGIFLGSLRDIDNIFSSKHNSDDISTFSKLYFNPLCEYKRYNLLSTNIKRTNKVESADAVVITKPEYSNFRIQNHSYDGDELEVLIMYSTSENKYYIVDTCLDRIRSSSLIYYLQSKFNLSSTEGWSLESFAKFLINYHFLPDDCIIYYRGFIVGLNSIKEMSVLYSVINRYSSIIYDVELERYINELRPAFTIDDLMSIYNMIKSPDVETIKLGIKLLNNFNISNIKGILLVLVNTLAQNSAVDRSVYASLDSFSKLLKRYKIKATGKLSNPLSRNKFIKLYNESKSDVEKQFMYNYCKDELVSLLDFEFNNYKPLIDTLNIPIKIAYDE